MDQPAASGDAVFFLLAPEFAFALDATSYFASKVPSGVAGGLSDGLGPFAPMIHL
jgi:hypothetical protein